jgi:hypothetical protein
MPTYTDFSQYVYSGTASEGTGTAIVDARISNGTFLTYWECSGIGKSALASAVFSILHSHDSTAWTPVATLTASAGTTGQIFSATARYAAGPYAYLGVRINEAYSAAETGTAHLQVYIMPGLL